MTRSSINPDACSAWILVFLLALPSLAVAETYQVAPDGSGDFPTIADAILGVPDESTIELLPGRFFGPGNRDLRLGGKQLVIRSQSGDPSTCVIDCEGLATGIWYIDSESSASILEGITVSNGQGGYAGGIRILYSSPTIRNCVFRGNTCDPGLGGGGIYASVSSSLIEDCTFEENTIAGLGGGGFCSAGTPAPVVRRCTFSQNHATPQPFVNGAAIYSQGSSPTIEDCLVFGNDADGGCGGIMLSESSSIVAGCTIFDNSGVIGGMTLAASTPEVADCTIVGNTGLVGGVWSGGDSNPRFSNTIVAFNRGGVGFDTEPEITLNCCDLFGNEGGDWVGYIADQNGVDGNFSLDPLFCDATAANYTLRSDSPCLAANNPSCGQIGAYDQGCDSPVATRSVTWGEVKALFRR